VGKDDNAAAKDNSEILKLISELGGSQRVIILMCLSLVGGISGTLGLTSLLQSGDLVKTIAGLGVFFITAVLAAFVVYVVYFKGQIVDDERKRRLGRTDMNPIWQLLQAEVAQMHGLVSQPLVKEDLRFTLWVRGFCDESKDSVRATLDSEFGLQNLGNTSESFEFAAQVDVAAVAPAALGGHLKVFGEGDLLLDVDINFEAGREPTGLQRLYRRRVSIPPKRTVRFEWRTDEFTLALPYTEFWATAHPLVHMKFIINCQAARSLKARAACYRRSDSNTSFTSDVEDAVHTFSAIGPFLPYQGMFISLNKR
jgi:hypothetical protein